MRSFARRRVCRVLCVREYRVLVSRELFAFAVVVSIKKVSRERPSFFFFTFAKHTLFGSHSFLAARGMAKLSGGYCFMSDSST